MHEIRWSEAAADDLAGIIEYLADVNAIVAQRYGEDFRQLIELLTDYLPSESHRKFYSHYAYYSWQAAIASS